LPEYSESTSTSSWLKGGKSKVIQENCMPDKRCRRLACALTLILVSGYSAGQATPSRDRILAPVDASAMVSVPGTAHPLVGPKFDRGRTNPAHMITRASLVFRLSATQQADLDRLLDDQQDPSSPRYHKWITPEEYAERFGVTASDLGKISAWLKSQGLAVDGISESRMEIFFSGTVGQLERAFQTEIHNLSVRGEQHFANSGDISVPAAFAGLVLGVRKLNDFSPRPRLRRASPHFTSSLSGNHFLIPGDFATIYHLGPLYSQGLDGTGQKIAVMGQTAISLTDIRAFRTASGLSANDPTPQLAPNTGASTTCTGDLDEANLDLEWSGGVAKNATIIYVYAGVGTNGSCMHRTSDVFDALQYAINANVAPVISISYGNCEAAIGSSQAKIFQQWAQHANAQGQTITSAAGDDGAADCDFNDTSATRGLAVDVPASIPEVTGVGGTEFTGDPAATVTGSCAAATTYWNTSCSPTSGASALSYIPEVVWNDPVTSGATSFSATGGGASTIFGKPTWQTGPGVPNDNARDVPDLSLNASPKHDPYLICSQGSCTNGFRNASSNLTAVGGTSVGAPAFAGIIAIINQATRSSGQGNANSKLYPLAISAPSSFHDITTGNNNVPCTKGTTGCPNGGTIGFTATANYDQASGLGSIDAFNLVTSWPGFTSTPAFSLAANPLSFTIAAVGQSGTSSLMVGGTGGFTGTVALSCTVPSTATAQISCAVSPTSVALNPTTTSGTATLTVNALSTSGRLLRLRFETLAAAFMFPGLFFSLRAPRKRGLPWVGILAMALLSLTLAACGGGSHSPSANQNQSTPTTYPVTVTATSNGTSHTVTVNVTVQ
jgi:subtilase family serine protease